MKVLITGGAGFIGKAGPKSINSFNDWKPFIININQFSIVKQMIRMLGVNPGATNYL